MRIGLTFDLRKAYMNMGLSEEETAEFDSESTIEALETTIKGLGYDVERIGNVYELTAMLSSGQRWDLVFNITEGLYGRSRESQVPAMLEAFNIPYTFSDPLTLAVCLDKSVAKQVVRSCGIPTPEFMLIDDISKLTETALNQSFNNRVDYPLFIKPLAEGTGKGVDERSIINDFKSLKAMATELMEKYMQPVLIESYLPGREFTVGILGNGNDARVIGALEVKLVDETQPAVYSYVNKELCESRIEYVLVEDKKILKEAADVALASYRALGCRDAARVDIRADKHNRMSFIEMNPVAGLHPTHSDLPILCSKAGITYPDLLKGIIDSAFSRAKKPLLGFRGSFDPSGFLARR